MRAIVAQVSPAPLLLAQRAARWLLAAMLAAGWQGQAAQAAPADAADAQTAYRDIVGRFWTGSPQTGHPVTTSDDGAPVPPGAPPLAPRKGHLWEYGTEIQLIWTYWKATGSPDAEERLHASWRWLQSFWSEADISRCGVGTTSTAQDDAAWDAAALFELYEATRDPVALRYTRDLLDCAWNRWHDDQLGGGLWYNDAHAEKSSYQAPYAITLYDYSVATGDPLYFERAKSLLQWAEARLKRPDGIYWEGIAPSGQPRGAERPNDIHEAGSVSFLAGNMAWAVLNTRFYARTHERRYLDSAIATAAGIAAHERLPGNVLMNDRDAYTDGWAAYYYAHDVAPLLPPQGTADTATLRATARSVMQHARGGDGTYSANWAGTPAGERWNSPPHHSTRYRLNISANSAMWPVAAAALAR